MKLRDLSGNGNDLEMEDSKMYVTPAELEIIDRSFKTIKRLWILLAIFAFTVGLLIGHLTRDLN